MCFYINRPLQEKLGRNPLDIGTVFGNFAAMAVFKVGLVVLIDDTRRETPVHCGTGFQDVGSCMESVPAGQPTATFSNRRLLHLEFMTDKKLPVILETNLWKNCEKLIILMDKFMLFAGCLVQAYLGLVFVFQHHVCGYLYGMMNAVCPAANLQAFCRNDRANSKEDTQVRTICCQR